MGEAISKAEVQLCMAAKNIRKPTFSHNALRGWRAPGACAGTCTTSGVNVVGQCYV